MIISGNVNLCKQGVPVNFKVQEAMPLLVLPVDWNSKREVLIYRLGSRGEESLWKMRCYVRL